MLHIQNYELSNAVLRNSRQWTHYALFTPIGIPPGMPYFVDVIGEVRGRGALRCRYEHPTDIHKNVIFTWVTRDGGTPCINKVALQGQRLEFEIRTIHGYSVELQDIKVTTTCDPVTWSNFAQGYPRHWWALLKSHWQDQRSILNMISTGTIPAQTIEDLWDWANLLESK